MSGLTASSYAARRLGLTTILAPVRRQARLLSLFARQPGQHQRVVRQSIDSNETTREEPASPTGIGIGQGVRRVHLGTSTRVWADAGHAVELHAPPDQSNSSCDRADNDDRLGEDTARMKRDREQAAHEENGSDPREYSCPDH
jgi:hypothetical protein